MNVEAILLDVGGTVFDWKTAVASALGRDGTRSLRHIDPEIFGTEWRKRSLIEV